MSLGDLSDGERFYAEDGAGSSALKSQGTCAAIM
jgi:hypothetical protein